MADQKAEKARIKAEKKKLAADKKRNAKEAKKRAKEIAKQERKLENEAEGSGFSVFVITLFIIIVWLLIIGILIKLDVGHFGSEILSPLVKDIPSISWILPTKEATEDDTSVLDGYSDLKAAVTQIRELELELAKVQALNAEYEDTISTLKARVEKLSLYEEDATKLEKEKNLFYEEVIYAAQAPSIEEYAKWYELMEPENAEYWYKRVAQQIQIDEEFNRLADTFAGMKPKNAAAVLEQLDDINRAADILWAMDTEPRAKIMDVIDTEYGAKITKILDKREQ